MYNNSSVLCGILRPINAICHIQKSFWSGRYINLIFGGSRWFDILVPCLPRCFSKRNLTSMPYFLSKAFASENQISIYRKFLSFGMDLCATLFSANVHVLLLSLLLNILTTESVDQSFLASKRNTFTWSMAWGSQDFLLVHVSPCLSGLFTVTPSILGFGFLSGCPSLLILSQKHLRGWRD